MTRIPLDIAVAETGAATSGVLVAVMVADIDALEAELAKYRANPLWNVRAVEDEAFEITWGEPDAH